MKFIDMTMSENVEPEAQGVRYIRGCKGLLEPGSNESWGAGGKCRDNCRSAELETELQKFSNFRRYDREATSA